MINDLTSNGGLKQTHLLQVGSPALGAGAADASATVDQRGVARDAIPDIGAVEIPASASTGDGGGGCTLNPSADFDPGLLGLLSEAIGGLFWRRRRQGRPVANGYPASKPPTHALAWVFLTFHVRK